MSVEDEILAISAAWDVALIGNDADEVASFMADDWVYVDADGTTSKADVVEWISEVYAREDGQWLCILSQKTPAG